MKKFLLLMLMAFTVLFSGCEKGGDEILSDNVEWKAPTSSDGSGQYSYSYKGGAVLITLSTGTNGLVITDFRVWFPAMGYEYGTTELKDNDEILEVPNLFLYYSDGSDEYIREEAERYKLSGNDGYLWISSSPKDLSNLIDHLKKNEVVGFGICSGYRFDYKGKWILPAFSY